MFLAKLEMVVTKWQSVSQTRANDVKGGAHLASSMLAEPAQCWHIGAQEALEE